MSNSLQIKVGITYNPTIPLFYSGANQTALLLAELFTKLKYNITLVNTKTSDNDWWSDYPQLENIELSKLYQTRDLDLLIDIDGYINEDYHKKAAKKVVVFMRTFMQFTEMDNSSYPEKPYHPRSFKGVDEIWCWDIMNPENSIASIQTLFSCPIIRVPFIWSSSVVSHYLTNKTNSNCNLDNAIWTVHIAEKNIDNTSSSIIPLVAIKEIVADNNNKLKSIKYKCHNMEKIIDNRFLKENVLHNIESDKLPLEFIKKEPFYDWLKTENNIQLSHSRFIPLRIGLLNTLWLGIPLIHNSPILKDLHPVLSRLFYFGNEFARIKNALIYLIENPMEYYSNIDSIRKAIIDKWSIEQKLEKWSTIISLFFDKTYMINKDNKDDINISLKQKYIIGFTDWWPGFNYNSNFYLNALRHNYPLFDFEGIEYTDNSKPNIILFGPYSQNWKKLPNNIPKVFVSSENWNTPIDESISLYLTSSRVEDDNHMRLPTWMTFIDWFSNSTTLPQDSTENPILMPLHFATTSHPKPINDRQEFCAFVVSNPICQMRNETFKAINNYKQVNSGGALFNNIGGQLALKYPGGGSGDLSKHQFFSNHKFTISFENSQAPGYITEKVLHSKMAGCIPIYWGDKDTDTDFVPNSIINLSNIDNNPGKVLEIIKMLESNPKACEKIAATPILDETKKQKALRVISNMCEKILSLCKNNNKNDKNDKNDTSNKIPSFDKMVVINLDSRKDRWDNLLKSDKYIAKNATRFSAINGKTLQLNSHIYELFKNNDHKWKKSVMGCALSHIGVWAKLLSEDNTINSYLILEDDVRFDDNWINKWQQMSKNIPDDAELLYLGGVLPPNRSVLQLCLESVNDNWAKIKPNTYFTTNIPLPVFHFCAYSYIITKKGAKKLIEFLMNTDKKCFTSIDHYLNSPMLGLINYIATPLLTNCFQESDPSYSISEFNNFNRIDTFDSDIWNNTECFSQDDLESFSNPKIDTSNTVQKTLDIYFVGDTNTTYDCYEKRWLEELFGIPFVFKPRVDWSVDIADNTWFLVQRPHLEAYNKYFKLLDTINKPFRVIHLSNEFEMDDISFYSLPMCKVVLQNYVSKKVENYKNVITIPLGYYHKILTNKKQKSFSERKLVWSFHGTNWFNRTNILERLKDVVPNNYHLTPNWNHSSMTKEEHYLTALGDSKFCPILRGNNVETFRLYECLEAGTIPLYVRQEGDDLFWKFISNLGLRELNDLQKAKQMMMELMNNENKAEKYRNEILEKWNIWKHALQTECKSKI